ncbi:hypothetical protein Tco_1547457 [Tanacetum coccineum]
MYVSGRVDIFDMVDIDLFTVVALNMVVLKLGYTGESELMFYNYLRPLTSLDEGLYALVCEEDVRCLATLVMSFKFIEVYIEHGVTVLDSYLRALYETTKKPVCDSVTSSSLPQHDSSTHCKDSVSTASKVIDDVMRQLSFDETELDGEAGFADVSGSGVDSSGLIETQSELFVSEEPDVGLTQEPILAEVSTQEPIVAEVSTQEPIVAEVRTEVPIIEEVGTQEFSMKDVVIEDYVSSKEDKEDAEQDFQSSEDAGTDNDDVDEDFLVDEENEIVEPDVDVHLFGISMDLPFDNIGITNLVSDDVLEGEDVDVINADGFDSDDKQGQIKVLPPRTTEEILARERERKARTTLLMALREDHLAKFHKMTDAKEMWDAIKSRFSKNDESKKMQKYILRQQFEGFSVSNSEGLHKGYDRTKRGVDSLSFDDLYNNLRVFENDVKGSTASSSSTQNVAFVSKNISSTNDVNTAYSVSNTSEQLDEFNLEEMNLKWQVVMILMRMKKFYKKTGRKLQFDAKEPVDERIFGKQEDSKALVTIDGEGVDWISHSEEEEDYALMACNSSGSDIEAYTQGLKKVEAQLVAHQQGQLWYEQKIKFMKIDLDDKTDVLTYHKKLLAEAMKEKEDLKAKVEKWHNSSKNLGKLINTHMSANDKFGLGYGDHRYDGILSYENEVLQSVFKGKESDFENPPLYDRFVTAGGMNAVPPPMTGNYMPSRLDIEIDYSQFTYGSKQTSSPEQTQPSKSETQTSEFDTCESNISTETPKLVSEPVVNESNVACQPKVWSDAPIIEEYESDSEDEETVKNHFTHSKNPKVDKKELGYGFTARACFVCGSLNHLIRDCDFHEKRMAKQAELNNRLNRNSSQREIRPIWNNVQRVNNQNQFVPTAVLTRTGKIPVNTARASGTKLKRRNIFVVPGMPKLNLSRNFSVDFGHGTLPLTDKWK